MSDHSNGVWHHRRTRRPPPFAWARLGRGKAVVLVRARGPLLASATREPEESAHSCLPSISYAPSGGREGSLRASLRAAKTPYVVRHPLAATVSWRRVIGLRPSRSARGSSLSDTVMPSSSGRRSLGSAPCHSSSKAVPA